MASVTRKDKGREPFVTSIYVPNTEKPGYLKFERMATVGELYDYCKAALEGAGILEKLDYFNLTYGVQRAEPLQDKLRWLAVFAVTGDSEGFYLHIEAIGNGSRKLLILGKDLGSKMDTALQAVNVLAPLLS